MREQRGGLAQDNDEERLPAWGHYHVQLTRTSSGGLEKDTSEVPAYLPHLDSVTTPVLM